MRPSVSTDQIEPSQRALTLALSPGEREHSNKQSQPPLPRGEGWGEGAEQGATPLQTLRKLPKIELHVHLLGAVRRETFADLVSKTQAPISAQEIEAYYTRGVKPVGAIRVLRALDQWLLRTPDDFYRIAYEYLQDAAAHQVRYAEYFWNPTGTLQHAGLSLQTVFEALQAAMAAAQADFGIFSKLIPAIDREQPAEAAIEMIEAVIALRKTSSAAEQLIPGVGIDYREADHPPEKFTAAYALAAQAGLKTTAHAGEFGLPFQNVQTALQTLRVNRIDHGYTIVDSPELLAWAKERGICFTVAPSNSYYLRSLPPERWALDHPIRKMLRSGLKIHPNTDDPTLHHVTPTEVWRMMMQNFGASWQEVQTMSFNGLEAAWMEAELCERLKNELLSYFSMAK